MIKTILVGGLTLTMAFLYSGNQYEHVLLHGEETGRVSGPIHHREDHADCPLEALMRDE